MKKTIEITIFDYFQFLGTFRIFQPSFQNFNRQEYEEPILTSHELGTAGPNLVPYLY